MLELLERIPFPAQLDRIVIFSGIVAGAVVTPILIILLALLVFDEITAAELVFWLAAALIVGGALAAVLLPNIVHATLSLVVTLLGVAGIFLLLGSEFLALVQVLIYGGAIIIVFLFALMLTRIEDFARLTDHRQWPIAAVVAGLTFVLLAAAVVNTGVRTEPERQSVEFSRLGETLFTQWAVPFEVASLVLLVALIGAVVLVRRSGGQD